jgi:delta 1-pyrroline-5-carboxylate dehydrogenase
VATDPAAAFAWAIVILALLAVAIASVCSKERGGHGSSGPGPGAAGAMYDLLNQDKRNAIELIVEEKAGARDPEDADGNLPDLEKPKRPR